MPRIGLRRGSLAALAAACATAAHRRRLLVGQQPRPRPPAAAARSSSSASLPTVTMMVGGIDKQIYLPYQLAQSLGFYKKYGVNMVLSTELAGGVGAETAMASGQVNMAGAWYVHTINFQLQGKAVEDVAQLSGSPGERIMCATGTHITSPDAVEGPVDRRHRPRVRHRPAHPVPGRQVRPEERPTTTRWRPVTAPP